VKDSRKTDQFVPNIQSLPGISGFVLVGKRFKKHRYQRSRNIGISGFVFGKKIQETLTSLY
jgi:hypothetical protein